MKKIMPVLFISILVIAFFWQFFLKGLLSVPSDTIIGLYHPFRDLYVKDYPNGIPFKNFLITDPVRQQYPWRELVISAEKKLELPLWNPYNFAGTPLAANFQSASFYPLNILFFLLPFNISWSFLILLQPLLGMIFLYFYLDNLKLNKLASLFGAVAFGFSGFSVAWLEWGTIAHTALWLPLILLSIDKIYVCLQGKSKVIPIQSGQNLKTQLKNKSLIIWSLIFIFSLISSFFAGHLQIFFYLFLFSSTYFFARWIQFGRKKKILFLFIILNSLFIILTAAVWIPTLKFISLSARNVDVSGFSNPGWFVPWQNLIQFIVPDFFGNPTTLNYWGVWNYGELVGYVGIIPLILALFAMFYRRDKKTLFFGTLFFLSLIFALPTIFAKIPYILNIPFISTSQPTRLLFLTDFSLAILAAFGFDYFLKIKRKITIIYPLIFIVIILACLWIFIPKEHIAVVKNNLLLPTLLIVISSVLLIVLIVFQRKNRLTIIMCIFAMIITAFDLLRFGWKFTPFTKREYLFPNTRTIEFLQKDIGFYRIMSADSRILPPNFSTIYRLQSIDGYDPLYLLRYGELIAASERKKPNIEPPFGFNRIISPKNFESKITDLLGVKYVLSLADLESEKLKKVFQEGETRIYENKNVIPRAFFIENLVQASNKYEAIKLMFDHDFDVTRSAIVEFTKGDGFIPPLRWKMGEAKVNHYSENKVVINTENTGDGFLVLTDSFYPTWRVAIDSVETKIYRTDYNFRGIIVPAGKHKIEFYNSLF